MSSLLDQNVFIASELNVLENWGGERVWS